MRQLLHNTIQKAFQSIFFIALTFSWSIAQDYNVTMPQQCSPVTGGTEVVNFPNTPPNANSDGTLTISYSGDLNTATSEFIQFFGENSTLLGQTIGIGQCTGPNGIFNATIPMNDIINWAADGTITITAVASTGVNNICSGNSFCVDMTLVYGVTTAPNDIGVFSLDSPSNFCAGNQDLYATIANYGTTPVDSFTVNWAWNGVLETPFQVIAALDTVNGLGSSMTQVFLGNKSITSKDTIEIWTTMPNGMPDTVTVNDTLWQVLTPSLAGTFTIGGVGADYDSINAAILDLNTVGVCGPVVLELTPGMNFNEQVRIGEFIGASSTNSVTINGNGDTLWYVSSNSSDRATLTLDGADYITFNDLHISSPAVGLSGEYGWATWLTAGADYITFKRCSFIASNTWNSTFAQSFAATTSPTSATAVGTACNYLTIDSCLAYGGYYGMSLGGPSTGNIDMAVGNTVTNTEISSFYFYGLFTRGQQNALIEGNDINRRDRATISTFYGIYLNGPNPGTEVLRNHIHMPVGPNSFPTTGTTYGMFMTSCNGAGIDDIVVANNIIDSMNNTGTNYGMYMSTCSDIKLMHNTINLDNVNHLGTQSCYGIYNTGTSSNSEVKNNIVYDIQGSLGSHYGYYFFTIPSAVDNNNIYQGNAFATNYYGFNGSAHLTLTDWQTANSGLDMFSQDVNPNYTGFYEPGNVSLYNAGANVLNYVPFDYVGNTRPTAPDIGSYQTPPVINNIGIVSLDSPQSFCPGTENIIVTVGNLGGNQVTSFNVGWSIDGTGQTPVSSSVTLDTLGGSGSTTTQVTVGSHNFVAGQSYDFKIWTYNPNGQSDTRTNTDTIEVTLLAAINGSLIVGNSGAADYANFTSLFTDLELGGVCGPVIVNVEPGSGPYNEQIRIGGITGLDSINTLTINGNGDTLEYLSTNSAQRATLTIDGAKWITIRDLNIVALADGSVASTYGWSTVVTGMAEHITFRNCSFIASNIWNSTFSQAFAATTSPTSATAVGAACNYLTVDSCLSYGGYYGMPIGGPSSGTFGMAVGNQVTNSRVEDFYFYGLFIRGQENGLFHNNEISRENRPTISTFYGIYINGPQPGSRFTANNIHNPIGDGQTQTTGTTYGMYITNVNNAGGADPVVANNVIHTLNNGGSTYGTYMTTATDLKYYHNAVGLDNVNHNGTGIGYGVYVTGTSTNADIQNNIIFNIQGGSGAKYCVYYNSIPTKSDYNDLYINSTGPGITYIGNASGTPYTTLAAWQAAGYDSNSVSIDPILAPNMIPINPAVKALGTNLSSVVSVDRLGVSRPSTPDMGAYEFTPSNCIFPKDLSEEAVYSFTADFNWVEQGTATNWQLSHGPLGITPDLGTVTAVSTNPGGITGLSPTTDYSIFVRSVCGSGDTSLWVGPLDFTTRLTNDLELFSVDAPLSGCDLPPQDIDVEVVNAGGLAAATYQVDYYLNGVFATGQTVTTSLPALDTATITLTGIPIVGYQIHSFQAEVTYVGDGDTTNNKSSISFFENVQTPTLNPTGDTIICFPTDITLIANASNGTVTWEDSLGNVVHTGDTFDLGTVSSSQGYFVTSATSSGGSLDANPLVGGNGCGGGNMFDVIPNSTLNLSGFTMNLGASGTSVNVGIYYKTGTYLGNETNASAWTLHETVTVTAATGTNQPTLVSLTNFLTVSAGQTYGIFLNADVDYTNGTQTYSNTDLTINAGAGLCGLFSGVNPGRLFNGTVHYAGAGCMAPLTSVAVLIGEDPDTDFLFSQSGSTPLTMDFTGIVTPTPDSVIWNYGDGTTGSGLITSHTYATPGTKLVTMTAYLFGCDSSVTKPLVVLGIDGLDLSSQVQLYPNPASSQLFLDLGSESAQGYEIVDPLGKSILRSEESILGEGQIDVRELAPGSYLLKVYLEKGIAKKRFNITR